MARKLTNDEFYDRVNKIHDGKYTYVNDFRGGSILAKVDENSGCDAIEEDKYTTCASIPINECGAKKVDKCNK